MNVKAQALRAEAQQEIRKAQYLEDMATATGSPFMHRHYREKAETARVKAGALIQQANQWEPRA